MTTQYYLRNIRTLLTQRFSDEDLPRLCYDLPDFRPVYDQLARDTGKAGIIGQLLEHAEQKILLETLLHLTRKLNPARYEQHQPYYDVVTNPKPNRNIPGTAHVFPI